MLIRDGGEVDRIDNQGMAPICFAANAQCLEAVEVLLQAKCALFSVPREGHDYYHSVLWDVFETSGNILSRIVSELRMRLD
jgi:hypothetical protein